MARRSALATVLALAVATILVQQVLVPAFVASGAALRGAQVQSDFTGVVGGSVRRAPSVAVRARGPLVEEDRVKTTPKGWRKRLFQRMPTSTFTNEEIMQRIVTVLIHNADERWRTAPMKTVDIQKEIGLTGNQIKSKQAVMDALMMLERQKVVYKVKQNPKRWEIHADYMEGGLPRISTDKRDPWKFASKLKFERTTVPKYGPK
mmetsp:Transcript_62976/g.117107  ORF Transcript_62976/g.117107 Transcript_62976/m.117107 type:complete len:205 (-) Transcript_62976:47-661(-)